MLIPIYQAKFERDIKRIKKRSYNMQKLKEVMRLLINEEPLPKKYKDHALTGNWKGCRDLHIESDWLLIYEIIDNRCIFTRTGTHADIF